MDKTVIELFAGVGGFRVGLNKIKNIDENGKAIENKNFDFVWFNQWEPSTSKQYAFNCYNIRFGDDSCENSNTDISLVNKKNIPDHALLCGGFPCQDYSVARSLSKEKGIEGKKGALWWQIKEILRVKKTPFVLLENVDRLLKSPSKQRGRDFGIMLRCFNDLGYSVEWRVVNAADYGYPQRRRRVYIFAYKNNSLYGKKINKCKPTDVFNNAGLFAKCLPIEKIDGDIIEIDIKKGYKDLVEMTSIFSGCFKNVGVMRRGKVFTTNSIPKFISPICLKDIVVSDADNHFYLNEIQTEKFKYLRGRKKTLRTAKNGMQYYYSEGAMSPVDSLDLPGRTMLTSEGTVNRSTHIIDDLTTGKRRLLTPVECERLNQFPDDWTNTMPERKRYFMMGNALVCGVIEKLSDELATIIESEV